MPVLERVIGLPDVVAYAGATWDWHRIHYDPEYLAAKKLPAPVIDGQVYGALLAEQLTGWAGPGWRLSAMTFRFGSLAFAGETVRCEATVTERDDDRICLEARVLVVGTDRLAVKSATAELVRR